MLDEDIYRFLLQAKRGAKTAAPIVFSYLDYDVESHGTFFEQTLGDWNPDRGLNRFPSKSAIKRWARGLGLEIARLYDGDEKWTRLTEDFTYIDGRAASGTVGFGQECTAPPTMCACMGCSRADSFQRCDPSDSRPW